MTKINSFYLFSFGLIALLFFLGLQPHINTDVAGVATVLAQNSSGTGYICENSDCVSTGGTCVNNVCQPPSSSSGGGGVCQTVDPTSPGYCTPDLPLSKKFCMDINTIATRANTAICTSLNSCLKETWVGNIENCPNPVVQEKYCGPNNTIKEIKKVWYCRENQPVESSTGPACVEGFQRSTVSHCGSCISVGARCAGGSPQASVETGWSCSVCQASDLNALCVNGPVIWRKLVDCPIQQDIALPKTCVNGVMCGLVISFSGACTEQIPGVTAACDSPTVGAVCTDPCEGGGGGTSSGGTSSGGTSSGGTSSGGTSSGGTSSGGTSSGGTSSGGGSGPGGPCIDGSHSECIDNKCICVAGSGTDQCSGINSYCSGGTGSSSGGGESCISPDGRGVPDGSTQTCFCGGGIVPCSNGVWAPCPNSHSICDGGTCKCVPGSGYDLCASNNVCLIGPYADNLQAVTGGYCTGIAIFKWNYEHTLGIEEIKFQFQVDDNPNFASPEVDRVYDNLKGYPAGAENRQMVPVIIDISPHHCDANNLSNPYPPDNQCNYITFGTSYYWRVKVWDKNYTPSEWKNADTIFTYGYTHPCPEPEHVPNPNPPILNTPVIFNDLSICYKYDETTATISNYACKNGSNTSYFWNFGDGSPTSNTKGDVQHTYTICPHYSTLKICDETGCASDVNSYFCPSNLPSNKEISPF